MPGRRPGWSRPTWSTRWWPRAVSPASPPSSSRPVRARSVRIRSVRGQDPDLAASSQGARGVRRRHPGLRHADRRGGAGSVDLVADRGGSALPTGPRPPRPAQPLRRPPASGPRPSRPTTRRPSPCSPTARCRPGPRPATRSAIDFSPAAQRLLEVGRAAWRRSQGGRPFTVTGAGRIGPVEPRRAVRRRAGQQLHRSGREPGAGLDTRRQRRRRGLPQRSGGQGHLVEVRPHVGDEYTDRGRQDDPARARPDLGGAGAARPVGDGQPDPERTRLPRSWPRLAGECQPSCSAISTSSLHFGQTG